jgi:GT2 family glycosyltransferase
VKLSVVIPTHNRAEHLPRLLHSLALQTAPPVDFEVILVADGCEDNTATVARAFSLPFQLTCIELPASGAAAARNRGAAAAQADLLLFLDDDMQALPELVAAHLAAHAARPGGVVLGYFPIPPADDDGNFMALAASHWWAGKFASQAHWAHRFTFADFCTGNVSLPRQLFLQAGGFDERFKEAAGEDYDLGVRLLRVGARFAFARDAASWHHDQPTESRAFRRARQNGRSQMLITRKYPELFREFELGWPVSGPVLQPLHWLLWQVPGVASVLAQGLYGLMVLARRLRLRGVWRRGYGGLHAYWYWRGVRDAQASLAEIERLRQDAPLVPEASHEVELDVSRDLPLLPALLAQGPADAARLRYGAVPLGRVGPQAGAEALRPEHIREHLIERCGSTLLGLLLLQALAAWPGVPAGLDLAPAAHPPVEPGP